jgi:hypothetical protein
MAHGVQAYGMWLPLVSLWPRQGEVFASSTSGEGVTRWAWWWWRGTKGAVGRQRGGWAQLNDGGRRWEAGSWWPPASPLAPRTPGNRGTDEARRGRRRVARGQRSPENCSGGTARRRWGKAEPRRALGFLEDKVLPMSNWMIECSRLRALFGSGCAKMGYCRWARGAATMAVVGALAGGQTWRKWGGVRIDGPRGGGGWIGLSFCFLNFKRK